VTLRVGVLEKSAWPVVSTGLKNGAVLLDVITEFPRMPRSRSIIHSDRVGARSRWPWTCLRWMGAPNSRSGSVIVVCPLGMGNYGRKCAGPGRAPRPRAARPASNAAGIGAGGSALMSGSMDASPQIECR